MSGAILIRVPARRDVPRTLYAQIAAQIRTAVVRGVLQPGDRLPSEAVLTQQAQVACMTLRQALATLVHEGVLERRHGVGTFVV